MKRNRGCPPAGKTTPSISSPDTDQQGHRHPWHHTQVMIRTHVTATMSDSHGQSLGILKDKHALSLGEHHSGWLYFSNF